MTVAVAVLLMADVRAQDQEMTYDEIEKKQDKIEDLHTMIFGIIDAYPDATYRYVYDDGEVTDVVVTNIPDNRDSKQLAVHLIDLEDLKAEIMNLKNRTGVYYVTETEPRPVEGRDEFFRDIQGLIQYPESAESHSVEGTIYVKFVVDSEGNIENIYASENVESPGDWIVQDMKQEAIRAVKATSGDWEPATVGGVPVSDWVVVPVQFKLTSPMFQPRLM